MKVAIVGLEQVGKTTLFGALTRQPVKVGSYGAESSVAVVEVPDRRVDALIEMFQPRKQTRATVEFVDGGAAGGTGSRFGPQFLQEIRQSEALVAVVRAFRNPAVPEPEGGLDPLRDYRNLEAELILADLDLVEKRLERMEKQDRSRPKSAQGGLERDAIIRIREHLERELPLSALELGAEEEEATRHLDFVSRKPLVVVPNIGEADLESGAGALLEELKGWAERSGTPVVPIAGAVELEIAQLGPEDEASFLEAMGLEQSGRDRLIRTVYELLGLISFFTVGEDEVRAWTIRRGDNAVTAAGKIHSDLARGFIRAEVIAYEALMRAGGPKQAKDQGLYRLEGKPYVVQDGDILNIRFSV
jgi:GTP-binding protein YchF